MALRRDKNLVRFAGRERHHVNVKGMIPGADVFVLGGGPSLLGTDLSLLDRPGVCIAALNNASAGLTNGVALRGHLWFGSDPPERYTRSVLLDPTIQKFASLRHAGDRISGLGRTFAEVPNVLFWEPVDGHEPLPNLLDEVGGGPEVPWKHSTLFAALYLLVHLGASRIHLLGVDFAATGGAFHEPGVDQTSRQSDRNRILYTQLVPPLETLRDAALEVGVEIDDCNPASALTVFPHRPLAECVDRAVEPLGIVHGERALGRYLDTRPAASARATEETTRKRRNTRALGRRARIRAAREWIPTYRGPDLLEGYQERFGVDRPCALRDLERLGIRFDDAPAARPADLPLPAFEDEAWGGDTSDYEENGFSYGIPWEATDPFDVGDPLGPAGDDPPF